MNPTDRRFCRRCGAALAAGQVTADRPPWWRRLWRWLRARRRPRLRIPRAVTIAVLALVLVAAAGWAAQRWGPGGVNAVRDRIATAAPIRPVQVRASSETAEHPAAAAVDGLTNRYWSPQVTGDGVGQYVEATFAEPFRLLDIIVQTGASPRQDEYVAQPRVAVVELTARTSDGRDRKLELRLADRPGEQHFRAVIGGVVGLRLTVRGAYGAKPDRSVALAEIEFFRRP